MRTAIASGEMRVPVTVNTLADCARTEASGVAAYGFGTLLLAFAVSRAVLADRVMNTQIFRVVWRETSGHYPMPLSGNYSLWVRWSLLRLAVPSWPVALLLECPSTANTKVAMACSFALGPANVRTISGRHFWVVSAAGDLLLSRAWRVLSFGNQVLIPVLERLRGTW